jgi:hypothetical protein
MKVKTSIANVQQLIVLLQKDSGFTQTFLNGLPTPEKYAILAMAWTVICNYEDFEEAHYEAQHKVSAKDLTSFLIEFQHLECHLQDALKLKWEWFEVLHTDREDEEDENNEEE